MHIRIPDLISVYTETGRQDFRSDCGRFEDVSYQLTLKNDAVSVDITADVTPICYLRLRWHFTEAERRDEMLRIYGDAWERGGGELEWRGIVPERCMPWFTLLSNGTDRHQARSGRLTEAFGVRVRPAAFCFWQYDADGLTLWMDVRCGGKGVLLGGRTLHAGEILFRTYENCTAFEAGQRFCKEMSPEPLTTAHPVYGSNNWYYAYGDSSHEAILEDARNTAALCAGLKNRPYMVIDDGWSPNPKNGPWTHGRASFPDMPGLAAEMKKLGVRPGIWTRYIADEGQVCNLPAEWHVERDDNYLDPSHPDVLNYIRETTKRFCEWGYELIKFDCSTQDILGRRGYRVPNVIAEDGWAFYDRSKTSAEIVLNFYKTIRETAGKDVVLIGCATISHLTAGLVELGRTGADVNGRSWDITRKMGVNTLAFRMMHHGSFFEADADCIGISGGISWENNRKWLKLLSESGTPLFVSCKPGILNEAQLEELRTAYRHGADQTDTLIPLDWMENICPRFYLMNGQEVSFDWFDDSFGCGFDGLTK